MLPGVSTSLSTAATSLEHECWRAAGLVALGGTAAAVLLWASTFPGWPIAAGVILSVLILAGLLMIMGAEPLPAAGWLRPAALVAALAVAIGGGLVVERSTGAALLIRFEASRSAFEAAVGAAGPPTADVGDRSDAFPGTCPVRLGSYPLAECRSFDGGYLFLQRRDALGDKAGFAYLPGGLSVGRPGADQFTHLTGPWYGWSCGC